MQRWQLQEAKARLSEVVKEASLHGPQEITMRGEPVVIVIAKREYDKLVKPKLTLPELMRQSPLRGVKLDLRRDTSLTRDIPL